MVFLCCLKCGFQEITEDDEGEDSVVVCVRCHDWFGMILVDSEWDLANHQAQYHRSDSLLEGKFLCLHLFLRVFNFFDN